jgi:hypothetical protein
MKKINRTQKTSKLLVFLSDYIEDLLVLAGTILVVVACYLFNILLGLLINGIILVLVGTKLSKMMK